MKRSERERLNWVRMTARYTGLAFLLPACTLVGYLLGGLLDKLLGTSFLYMVFLVVGILAGFVQLYREISKEL
jgi:F0F1-type ATP synthase assembly protein I